MSGACHALTTSCAADRAAICGARYPHIARNPPCSSPSLRYSSSQHIGLTRVQRRVRFARSEGACVVCPLRTCARPAVVGVVREGICARASFCSRRPPCLATPLRSFLSGFVSAALNSAKHRPGCESAASFARAKPGTVATALAGTASTSTDMCRHSNSRRGGIS